MTVLPFVSRIEQLRQLGLEQAQSGRLNDSLFDGLAIPGGIKARNWITEFSVHKTVLLSNAIGSTRNFLGPQANIVRDEVHKKTWATFIEADRLMIAEIVNNDPSVRLLAEGGVWRSHLTLDKFSGRPLTAWVTRSSGSGSLWFDRSPVPTSAVLPDFPFFRLSQVPIGHVQTHPAPYGLLSYKDRSNGRLFIRHFDGHGFGEEQEIKIPNALGGLSLAISQSNVIARVDVLEGERINPMIAYSSDAGATFGAFESISTPLDDSFMSTPSGRPTVDHLGFFHVPLSFTDGNEAVAFDAVLGRALVEAIRVPGSLSYGSPVEAEAFPKKPGAIGGGADIRFGNGVTDGLGIIMVLESGGRLFTSNSQAGGLHYPPTEHLNHEMPKIAAFCSTECYTSGLRPNVVSMDYAYVEQSPDTNLPYSGELHYETWDMPLPEPSVIAQANSQNVQVTIESDANFYAGQTTFDFDDPAINIIKMDITDARHAIIQTDSDSLVGKRLCFDVKTLFYHHSGMAVVR